MTYRCIHVKSANQLSLKHNSVIATNKDKVIEVPLEDIALILVEDNKVNISGKLLSALAENNIGLIMCNDKYMPCSLTLPIANHYRQLRVVGLQMNVKKPVNSQLWAKIIESKIKNQLTVIKLTANNEYYYEKISSELLEIKSNDKTNREAVTAKYHFAAMFGDSFIRRRSSEEEINAALNYGYTIIMSCMARMLCKYGFNTIFGIHHCSYMNNYNLACDLMEPFRPLVDKVVYDYLDDLSYPLSTMIRQELVAILVSKVRLNNKVYLVEYAMEEMVLSYIKVLENQDSSIIKLPEIIENSRCTLEDENEL